MESDVTTIKNDVASILAGLRTGMPDSFGQPLLHELMVQQVQRVLRGKVATRPCVIYKIYGYVVQYMCTRMTSWHPLLKRAINQMFL